MKKLLAAIFVGGVVSVGAVYALYVTNETPRLPPVTAEDAANSSRPYVVKLHAQWCPKCMMTKDVWGEVERAYAGRVNLVVLDFTDDARTAASRAEARRLGLESIFDDYEGVTGAVLVIDGATRAVKADISGSRDLAEYRVAIEDALTGEVRASPQTN